MSDSAEQLQTRKEKTRERIALVAVLAYLFIPVAVVCAFIYGTLSIQNVKDVFEQWHLFSGWLVAGAVSYYFGSLK